ncbi:MAG TPA: prolyl oligopeptidase family serine peptidase [Longimicrobiales bacterium]|nr:prolyl oligopeptidase family serine peptidase [Longimicrobiales bacterium]
MTMTRMITPMGRSLAACAAAALLTIPASLQAQEDDPWIWLEEVEGDRAMEWVLERNAETRQELQALPSYRSAYDETLEILTSDDRIAFPSIQGEWIYNFWTDGDHPRGTFRRTSWEDYLGGSPTWETVLDVDALAEAEGKAWAFRGMSCLAPEDVLCLVSLSPGGSDAVEVREFDLSSKSFVEGGFHIPVSKNGTAWIDENTLLVHHNLDPAYTTTSGYSRAAWRWTRGTALADAEILAEAEEQDMGMFVGSQETTEGPVATVARLITIFDREIHILEDGSLDRLDVPTDASFQRMGDQMVLLLVSDWTVNGRTFPAGSVVSANYDDYRAGQGSVELMIEPGDRSTINGISRTRDYLLVTQLNDVQGELVRYWREGGAWRHEAIETPPMGAVSPGSTSPHHNRFFFTYTSFTRPTTLYLAEEDGDVREVRSLPAQFDARGLTVEQHHATSADGTRVPYFVVRPENAPTDGSNPTLLTAYGGFQISRTPGYLGSTGKTWVEKGGVYVLANIRGGGEFGPDWWKAALKENRQRAYDDFIAVSEDLIARGITSPEHLGIQGGSNGGLLVGVAMTQRPDLYNAVVVNVPLLDMRRYHTLLAGASWMAEYGDPDDPEEWAFIREYSPYQNVRPGVEYPTPFIFTTTRDDRVHPGHARKMAAKMESMGYETIYFENVEGGHGSGVTPEQRAESAALTMAYLNMRLGTPRRPISQ